MRIGQTCGAELEPENLAFGEDASFFQQIGDGIAGLSSDTDPIFNAFAFEIDLFVGVFLEGVV